MLALALVLTMLGQQPDPTIELLKADRNLSTASGKEGLAAVLPTALAAEPVLLLPGAPVLKGHAAITAALAKATAEQALAIQWNAQSSWLSLDAKLGVTAGAITATPREPNGQERRGSYIAVWRLEGGAWKLAALMQAGLAPGDRPLYDPAWGPKALPALSPSGATKSIVAADLDFSARAGTSGAPDAFQAYAAPDAIVYGGAGARRGPEEIGQSLARGDPADWSWAPVVAGIAGSGDLGYTVGQAVIAPKSGGAPAISKYLTIWRRQPDGSMRFLTDGGNPRPAP